MSGLRGRDLAKEFTGGVRALDGVSFEAPAGRVLTLLGPSGCGKTTLLRVIAGLEAPTGGTLELDGRDLLGVPAGKRDVGFVFQNYALYPHLTVEGNLSLTLEARGVPRPERAERVRAAAKLMELEPLLGRKPAELSGGQQQRVALGRALVRRPRLYLLDEPLSNLDAVLRETMRSELKTILRRVDATAVYVTHDQAEAMSLSDRLAVMRGGRILQEGTPMEIYRRPAEAFVATFVGSPRMTLWRVGAGGDGAGAEDLPAPPAGRGARGTLAGIRPEDVDVTAERAPGTYVATVESVELLGARALLSLRSASGVVRALAAPTSWPERVWVRWPAERIHWFDTDTERRLDGPAAAEAT